MSHKIKKLIAKILIAKFSTFQLNLLLMFAVSYSSDILQSICLPVHNYSTIIRMLMI